MSVQVKRRRDTAANIAGFTPAQGEIIVDTNNNRLIVGDGTTAGGFPAARLSEIVPNTGAAALSLKGNSTGSTGAVTDLTVAQVQGMLLPFATTIILRGVDLNVLGDTVFTVPLPSGITRYQIVYAWRLNGSIAVINTAEFGIYTAPSQGGLVLLGQTLVGLTSNTVGAAGSMIYSVTNNVNTAFYNQSALYLNVGTVQGAAATCDIVLIVQPMS